MSAVGPPVPSTTPPPPPGTPPPPPPPQLKPDLTLENDCPTCAAEISKGQYALAEVPHPKDQCCTVCRYFSLADLIARNPMNQLKALRAGSNPTLDANNKARWPEIVARELVGPYTSRTIKARILYVWVATNLSYSYTREQEIIKNQNDTPLKPEDTLEAGGGVCGDLAELYYYLCRAVNLTCHRVSGITKDQNFGPVVSNSIDWKSATFASVMSIPEVAKRFKKRLGHVWNIVEIDGGVPKIVDVTMGGGASNNLQAQQNNFYYSAGYFNIPNERFALSHYPRWLQSSEQQVADYLCWETPATLQQALDLFKVWITNFAPPSTMFPIDGLSILDHKLSGIGGPGNGVVLNSPGWTRFRVTFGCKHAKHKPDLEFVINTFEPNGSGGLTKKVVTLSQLVPAISNDATQNTYQFPTNDGQVQMSSLLDSVPSPNNNPAVFLYVKHVNAADDDLHEVAEWRVIPIVP